MKTGLLYFCLLVSRGRGDADEDEASLGLYDDDYVKWRIAFGSCAKQYLPQAQIWESISDLEPDAFIWIGDAGYPNCTSSECVAEAFDKLKENEAYTMFRESPSIRLIDGVWDDHDFGLNDGGSDYEFKAQNQQLFLNFLDYEEDSPLRSQQGLYHSIIFGESPNDVHLILLDTRYFKETSGRVLPSQIPWLPLGSHLASIARWLSGVFGIGFDYKGDLLGETQWLWLENTLKESDASLVIIASSIQILSNNPIFESWGHYPYSRQMLFEMIANANPKALVFLSGDVHFAQVLGDPDSVVELTSSGLTHTVLTSLGGWLLTDAYIPFYGGAEAFFLEGQSPLGKKSFYEGKNFGTVDVNWDSDEMFNVTLQIFDYEGTPRIKFSQIFDNNTSHSQERYNKLLKTSPLKKHRNIVQLSWRIVLTLAAIILPPMFVLYLLHFYAMKLANMWQILKRYLKKQKATGKKQTKGGQSKKD
eukprot:GHVP01040943.1.p1 GENE.GHVP01040943.1~~GHVP01040943.1.p1  ORF type:complete len:475 (-),score=89.42 GHVP01040943.1:40-1464(-)